jgi:hypothetical protein
MKRVVVISSHHHAQDVTVAQIIVDTCFAIDAIIAVVIDGPFVIYGVYLFATKVESCLIRLKAAANTAKSVQLVVAVLSQYCRFLWPGPPGLAQDLRCHWCRTFYFS